jgi:pimeloyl-ACP methyl ester carboxylesterase
MPRFASPHDSASLFYRDYNPEIQSNGSEHKDLALVFLHSWPMSSRMWEQHLVQLCQDHGFRCIAPDRRGCGESEWNGRCSKDITQRKITYDTLADDVIFLLEDLAVEEFVFIGGSMGCGESLLAWKRSAYVQQHCKVLSPLLSPIKSPTKQSLTFYQ